MPLERVLVCGGGVAGSTLAFWLGKYGYEVLVIERSRASQKAGQGIEIEEPALEVVRQMGVLEQLEQKKTGELGFELLDEKSRLQASFEVGGFGPTGSLELMRGDLTQVLYKAADNNANVTFEFETTIESIKQTEEKVSVELYNRKTKSTKTEEIDFVIGADGAKSRTRQLVMGPPEEIKCFKPVGAFVAYFSIPKEERDWPNSRLCNFPNRKIVWLRPIGKDSDIVSVYLIHVNSDNSKLSQAIASGDRQKQKEALAELYAGLGWETPRVIEHMMKADNFYCDELAQVKLPRWYNHRVVLVGDAAWAPTPFTGEGNQMALIGAWVLAQELSRNRSTEAFEKYDRRLRAHIENAQSIPLGGYMPHLCCPQTTLGIWLFRTAVSTLARALRLASWINLPRFLPEQKVTPFDLEVDKI